MQSAIPTILIHPLALAREGRKLHDSRMQCDLERILEFEGTRFIIIGGLGEFPRVIRPYVAHAAWGNPPEPPKN